jgi:hypothetical protein
MILRKAKTFCLPVLCCMALALVLFQVPAKCYGDEITIVIDVAPNVLNIQSESAVVTVHTDIAYLAVAGAGVFLNDVAIDWWKSDAQGNFVAKFLSDEIKTLDGLIEDEYNTLTLTGYTAGGDTFIGEQPIMVINNDPVGTGKK